MKTATAVALLCAGLAVSVIGCATSAESNAGGPAPAVSMKEMNQAKMHDALVPAAVQTSFSRDYPTAAIDNIRMDRTSTGEPFYQIFFIRNGRPGTVRYYASGKAVPGT